MFYIKLLVSKKFYNRGKMDLTKIIYKYNYEHKK